MRSAWCTLWIAAAAAGLAGCSFPACQPERKAAPAPRAEEQPALVGVWPADFRCETVASAETMTQLLGAPARQVETAIPSTAGTPAPCAFLVAAADQEAWNFDIDCRDGMKTRADALFAQYERTSADAVAAAAAQAAEPSKASSPADAAKPRSKVELAREVNVGARGLDHHGSGLLFIDDDAPCYVRITGPDAERRMALARHLVSALTLQTAPMSPRPAPR